MSPGPAPSPDDALQRAMRLAVEAHAGQVRDGELAGTRLPYVAHPFEVMTTVWRWGAGTPAALVAAALHDTVEDTDVTLDQVEAEFGPKAAGIVRELTFAPPPGLSPSERGKLKNETHMATFATASPEALAIKLADRLCNCMEFHVCGDPGYAPVYFEKAAHLFRAMHDRLADLRARFGEPAARNILAAYRRVRDTLGVAIDKRQLYGATLRGIEALIEGETDLTAVLATVACELHHALPYFHWTGFYRVVAPGLLKIGPYQGAHGCLTIPFDQGVCGAAARTKQTQLVPDVRQCAHHLACSSSTRSEIVVPVLTPGGRLLAVLDVDSDHLAAFDEADRHSLETLCSRIGAGRFTPAT